jgi:hypothetical protein
MAENHANSSILRMFLGCGKVVPIETLKFTETSNMQDALEINGRTPVFPVIPERLSNIVMSGGKRQQEGGVERPSKRTQNLNFEKICTFWWCGCKSDKNPTWWLRRHWT